MRSNARPYRWAGAIALVGSIVLVALNVFGGWRWVSSQLFIFEGSARSEFSGANAPAAWQSERTQLLEQVAQLKGLADENARLREALHFFSTKKYAYTMATVISRDPLSPSLVSLDVGSDDGIIVGQPVVMSTGTLVGKILKVTSKNSTLELFTADSARVAVKALDDTSTSGVVRGSLGTGARLEYIRDVKTVPVGTILVTSGLEPLIPQGFVVGTVQKVTENADALFAYADVLPAADMSQLSIVSILRGL